jgi:hypothetical protein
VEFYEKGGIFAPEKVFRDLVAHNHDEKIIQTPIDKSINAGVESLSYGKTR